MKLVPDRMHSPTEVQNARTKGQVIGWIQGAGVTIATIWVLKLVGWIPALLVIGALGFVGFKLLFRKKKQP
jgi:hypothetical protein